MQTQVVENEIYEGSKSFAQFRRRKLSINDLLDWRINLKKELESQVFDANKIYIEYEIEATDVLLDKANKNETI